MANRQYLPQDFKITTWDLLLPYYQSLLDCQIDTIDSYKQFLHHVSELESMVSEDLAWRYIKMTCDTTDENLEKSYVDFVTNIQPNIAPFEDKINHKINNSPFLDALKSDEAYKIYFRAISNSIDLFREENIPLRSTAQVPPRR